ncbi:hypothetical protein P1994_13795, partial [Xanthomonas perforans]
GVPTNTGAAAARMRRLRQDVPDGAVVGAGVAGLGVVGDSAAAARPRVATGGLAAMGERE